MQVGLLAPPPGRGSEIKPQLRAAWCLPREDPDSI